MIVSSDSRNGLTILSINGRVDGASALELEDELVSTIRDGSVRILIDCNEMNYIGSAGMRVFLLAARRCRRAGGLLSIAALQPACKSVVEMGGFHTIIDCHDTRDEALAATPEPSADAGLRRPLTPEPA